MRSTVSGSIVFVAAFSCMSCVAASEEDLTSADAADLFSIRWPAPQYAARENGTWYIEHRWTDEVRGVSYEEAFSRWVATVETDDEGLPFLGAPPSATARNGGERLAVPVLDCADWAIALRFAFAATHRLQFALESNTAVMSADAGFAGFSTREPNVPVQRFLEGLGLTPAAALFGTTVMARFRSADLASDRNTYLVSHANAHAGDVVSDLHHTRVIGELTRLSRGRIEISLIEGAPGLRPQWSENSVYDVMSGVELGSGPRRFRTESEVPATLSTETEIARWRAALNISERELFGVAVET